MKQKSGLEKELISFLGHLLPMRDITSATPEDVVNFLIWKDNFGKTRVHLNGCHFFGHKGKADCSCPRRLAFGTVDSLIGKLRSIFSNTGRGGNDSSLPGFGNPAASKLVKDYLSAMRVEQLEARVLPSQADPFFISDLAAVARYNGIRVNEPGLSPKELFVSTRDQAFLKTLFFAGDRAGDLGKVKTQELLYFPRKEGLLFNHVLTKTLRDGTSNLFSLKRYRRDPSLCPVTAIEVYIAVSELMGIPLRDGYLFRPLTPSGEVALTPLDSTAAQSRLATYVQLLPHVFGKRRITLHGLRSGCAISLAMSGLDLQTIMSHVGWKTPGTARHYLRMEQVLRSGGAGDSLAELPLDLAELYRKQNELTGFTQAFERDSRNPNNGW
jgi:integrase